VGPFDLKAIRPENLNVGLSPTGDTQLLLTFTNPLPVHDQGTDGTNSFFPTTKFAIFFATREMADRHAKAWHDAIIGCGGKAVPDNLY
jgi:hypothetical protein